MTTDERLNRIYQKQEQILDKQDDILRQQAAQAEVCKARELRLHALEGATFGNARPGLKSDVVVLKDQVADLRRIRGKAFWALVSLVAAVVSGGLLIVGEAALAWVKS